MLVGRGRELDGADAGLDACAAGRPILRVLVGEAGIGKTRLADEIAEHATRRGFAVSWGRAWETGGAPPYWPWIEAMRPLATGDDVPPPVRALVDGSQRGGASESMRGDPARERFELFDGTLGFLRAFARREPLLLVFDDLHTADLPSLELLAFVARGLRSARCALAIVTTWRDAEARLPPVADVIARIAREAEVQALRPLSAGEVLELATAVLGEAGASLAPALFEVTEGNPLFLHETLHAVAARREGATLEALREVAASGGVAALVRGRLTGAGDGCRLMLDVASVIGREVPLPLLAEVTGTPLADTQRALDEATARGLAFRRGGDRWVFAHVLVREAFYRELAPDRRCAVHASIARALEARVASGRDAELATLAHHQLAALPTGDAVHAVATARRAADRARRQLAYEEAIALLERALAACDGYGLDAREHAEVILALGWARTEAGALEPGRAMFREAAAIARHLGDPRLLARAALGQGGQYVLGEIRAELVGVLREALAALEIDAPDDRRLRARVLARLAAALTPSPTPDEPLAYAREALAMVAEDSDAVARVDIDVATGSAMVDFAPAGERLVITERLLRGARALGDRGLELRALTRLVCDHLERGDIASADAAIEARARLADELERPKFRWQTPLLRSMRAMPAGDFAACEAWIREARAIAADAADPNSAICIEFHRFCVLLVAGRPDELAAQLPTALRAIEAMHHNEPLRAWLVALTAQHTGDLELARATIRATPPAHAITAHAFAAVLAECAARCDMPEVYPRLLALVRDDRETAGVLGPFAFVCFPPIAAMRASVELALGHRDAALAQYAAALGIARRMQARAHEAWVELGWGEALAKLGDASAREHLARATALAAELAMPEVLARTTSVHDAPVSPAPVPAAPSFRLVRDDDEWIVTHAGRSFRLRAVRGLAMIAQLVEHPDREIHVLDLAAERPGDGEVADVGDAGEVLDARARAAYKQRIATLRDDLDDAERANDLGRAEKLRYELEALSDQIAAAVGLGGRSRRTGSAAERARITVQRRIREAIKKIGDHAPELGRHLDWTIRTGAYCAYEPAGRVT